MLRTARFNFIVIFLLEVLAVPRAAYSVDWRLQSRQNGVTEVSISAKAQYNGVEVPAKISLLCYSQPTFDIRLEADILNTKPFTTFEFSDFEGPDAAFGETELAKVKVTSAEIEIGSQFTGGGWYTDNDQFRINLPLTGKSTQKGEAIVSALRDIVRRISIDLREYKQPKNILHIYTTGSGNVAALKQVLDSCKNGKI